MADDDTSQKGGKLKWILILVFVLLLGGAAAGAWYFFLGGPSGQDAAGGNIETKVVPQTEEKNLTTATLPTFLVNLADPLGRRYIKATIQVEIANPKVAEEITRQMPKIQDAVIMLLSSKTYADLMPTESKIALKTELATRLNQVLGGPKISRIFFTELVIQ